MHLHRANPSNIEGTRILEINILGRKKQHVELFSSRASKEVLIFFNGKVRRTAVRSSSGLCSNPTHRNVVGLKVETKIPTSELNAALSYCLVLAPETGS